MESISVIVPCFNEEENIGRLYTEICSALASIPIGYCILFVDDGSTDNTFSIVQELSVKDKCVKYVSFSRNFGKEAAMYAGLCNSESDYTVIMDADMQDPPYLIPKMLKIMKENGYDCVAARRANRKGEPFLRSFFSRQFYKLINRISDIKFVDGARDFRLMRKKMVDAVISLSEKNRFSKGIFEWVGFKTFWISYDNVERNAGYTKWSFFRLFRYGVDGIINFSHIPLSLASWFGVVMTAVSFFFLIVIVIRKLIFGDPVAGWASTACIIIFIGGIQLFCMGIMGQYLSKVYLEIKNRPHYIIAKTNKANVEMIR